MVFKDFYSFMLLWQNQSFNFEISTSGSTGIAKTIKLDRKKIAISAQQSRKTFPNISTYKTLCCLPTDRIGGFMQLSRAALWQVDCDIIKPSANPMKAIAIHHDYKNCSLSPNQLVNIFKDDESVKKLLRFELILIGGAAVTFKISTINKRLFKERMYFTFGMTETYSHIAIKKIEEEIFEALEGIEIQKNPNNCLEIRGDITENTWLKTNDIIEFIAPNKFMVLGRLDNIINSGGIKFNAESLEKIITTQINCPFYIGKTHDENLGEIITLFINKNTAINLTNLNIILEQSFGKFAKIKRVIETAINFNPFTGKITRMS